MPKLIDLMPKNDSKLIDFLFPGQILSGEWTDSEGIQKMGNLQNAVIFASTQNIRIYSGAILKFNTLFVVRQLNTRLSASTHPRNKSEDLIK